MWIIFAGHHGHAHGDGIETMGTGRWKGAEGWEIGRDRGWKIGSGGTG